jgi:hypothetical protein
MQRPKTPKPKAKRIDAVAILGKLAELRKSIPGVGDLPSRPRAGATEGRTEMFAGATMEDFDLMAVADGLEAFADDIQAVIEQKHAAALVKALEIYYAAEELARDPAHPELIPHVEAMRSAYEKQYGKPIPPKPKEK